MAVAGKRQASERIYSVIVKYRFCFSKGNSITLTTPKVPLSASAFFLVNSSRSLDNMV
jgi:hypothetical protein